MYIALLSYAGNVGKTLISNQSLLPNLENSEVIKFEGFNRFIREISPLKNNTIIDVQINYAEEFVDIIHTQSMNVDLFLIPVLPDVNTQRKTISLLSKLLSVVPCNKFKIIFNGVDTNSKISLQFRTLLESDVVKNIDIDFNVFLPKTDLYATLNASHFSLALGAKNQDRLIQLLSQRAKAYNKNFQSLYESIFECDKNYFI